MITTEQLERMTVEITLGIPKERSKVVKDKETDRWWERLVDEIADLKRSGFVVDMPNETPDVTTL